MGKLLLLVLLLGGCVTTVPVQRHWPSAPPELKQNCPELNEVPIDTEKLSEVLKVVTSNYALYHECRIKMNAWSEWYDSQKRIFEEVK